MADIKLLQMALLGYEAERQRIEQEVARLQKQLGGASAVAFTAVSAKPRHRMSSAARKRIGAAQKARWKAFHAKEGGPARKTASKRELSPETKAKLVANLAKARAARAAKAVTA
jgi:hypothetical protein